MAVPDRSEPPPRFAATGDTVAIEMVRERVRTVSTVTTDGTIEAPLCGSLEVGGREAHDICNAVSACLEQFYRRAAVLVTIDGEEGQPTSSGCEIEGPAKPEGWAAPTRAVLSAAKAAEDVDPSVLVRAADAASQYEVALIERTDEHPDVASVRTRVERLVEAAAPIEDEGDPARVRQDLATLLVGAERALAQHSDALGPKHPERRAAQARRDLLAEIEAALPEGDAAEPTPAELAVERIEVTARLEHARARLGPKHPQRLALEARAKHLAEGDAPAVPCETLRRRFALRLARLEGQRESGGGDELDPVIDALAIARARVGREIACETPPPPEPEPATTPKRASSRPSARASRTAPSRPD